MALSPNGIGFVPVPVPGTSVQVSATKITCKQAIFMPLKTGGVANTGVVYIGSSAMVKATGVGVLAALRPGDPPFKLTLGDELAPDVIDLSTLFIDANTAADAALVGYI